MTMRPVFANSASVAAPDRMVRRGGRWTWRALQVRYGFFVHPMAGPTLIDTGYTPHALHHPNRSRGLRIYCRALGPRLNADGQIESVLNRFGLRPEDITTVIITHFHADHVSGLKALPNARFISDGSAWAKVKANTNFQNVRHGVFSELLPEDFDARFDPVETKPVHHAPHLPEGRDVFGDGSVVAIPLPGHADGHFGLLFPKLDPPLLYAADTQWVLDGLSKSGRPTLLPRLVSSNHHAAGHSADIVEAYRQTGATVLLCHDDEPTGYDLPLGDS